MRIEVGKKYRTRDGSRVFGPVELRSNGDPHYSFKAPFQSVPWGYVYFMADGRYYPDTETDSLDLVEEVTDDRADNSGPAVVHGHDTPACHCDDDGAGCVGLETSVLEQRTKGLRSRLVSGLAAVSRVVRRLCGVSTVRDRDDHDLSSR